jgi:hypothetical protein
MKTETLLVKTANAFIWFWGLAFVAFTVVFGVCYLLR